MEYLYYLRNFNAFHIYLLAAIKHMGIVKTDAAQRLSLFIPLLAAWLIFNENFNLLKITAFLILSGAVADSFKTGN
jgi:drug/metabolite transporter (DMT)-like permease